MEFQKVRQEQIDDINRKYGSLRLANEKQMLMLMLKQAPRDDDSLRQLILNDVKSLSKEEEENSLKAQYETLSLYTGKTVEDLKAMDTNDFVMLTMELQDYIMDINSRELRLSERLLNEKFPEDIKKQIIEIITEIYSDDDKKKD
jgi:hypothetical protein